VLPMEDTISGTEKAICSLPDEDAEEIWQETVRIASHFMRPKDNLTRQKSKPCRPTG
jgi:hypothetical protein